MIPIIHQRPPELAEVATLRWRFSSKAVEDAVKAHIPVELAEPPPDRPLAQALWTHGTGYQLELSCWLPSGTPVQLKECTYWRTHEGFVDRAQVRLVVPCLKYDGEVHQENAKLRYALAMFYSYDGEVSLAATVAWSGFFLNLIARLEREHSPILRELERLVDESSKAQEERAQKKLKKRAAEVAQAAKMAQRITAAGFIVASGGPS